MVRKFQQTNFGVPCRYDGRLLQDALVSVILFYYGKATLLFMYIYVVQSDHFKQLHNNYTGSITAITEHNKLHYSGGSIRHHYNENLLSTPKQQSAAYQHAVGWTTCRSRDPAPCPHPGQSVPTLY